MLTTMGDRRTATLNAAAAAAAGRETASPVAQALPVTLAEVDAVVAEAKQAAPTSAPAL